LGKDRFWRKADPRWFEQHMSASRSGPAASSRRMLDDGLQFTTEFGAGKVRVRICGIDAPERGQPGHGQAAGVLSNMIEGKTVHCLQVGEGTPCDGKSKANSRDRVVAQCFLGKLDIAEEMARSGTVCDWPKFSGGRYRISDQTCVRR
jgi:endonuclease YncB( thermonuclease family)